MIAPYARKKFAFFFEPWIILKMKRKAGVHKAKVNLSLHQEIIKKGERLCEVLHCSFSELVQRLVLSEWEKRNGPIELQERYPQHREQVSYAEERPPKRKSQ